MALFARPAPPAFSFAMDGPTVRLVLAARDRRIPVTDWRSKADPAAVEVLVAAAEDDRRADDGLPLVALDTDAARLHPAFVASLPDATARALGLPAATQLALDLQTRGQLFTDESFTVATRWMRPGGAAVRASVTGPFVTADATIGRIPEPLYSVHRAALRLAHPSTESDRYAALEALQAALPQDLRSSVAADDYLRDTRIHYAAGFSVATRAADPLAFDPVLFGRGVTETSADSLPDEARDSVLADRAQTAFAERFAARTDIPPAYVLGSNEYVFIEPAMRSVLKEVRQLQGATAEDRKEFLLNPRRVLRDRLAGTSGGVPDLDSLFIETDQFSQRVASIAVWKKAVLPWLKPIRNSWWPESFGLQIDGVPHRVEPKNAGELAKRVAEAAARGEVSVATGDLIGPGPNGEPPPKQLPVNDDTAAATAAIGSFGSHQGADAIPDARGHEEAVASDLVGPAEPPPVPPAARGKMFLVVRDNLFDVEYLPAEPGPATTAEATRVVVPAAVRTLLKPHQEDGLAWLANCIRAGRTGALLADDMGLGKTLQAIAFAAWLQGEAAAGRREAGPILVVAPTGLLANWRQEIGQHLASPFLGPEVLAYGGGIREIHVGDLLDRRVRDVDVGSAHLDRATVSEAGIVLTTYETLRDYHLSFARIRFGLVVFDEIQKLKNPSSQITRAAKTLNASFLLGLTGTPVENRLQDLWSIMDVLMPGGLGSSRSFETAYPSTVPERLRELKGLLTEPSERRPPRMLRRMKGDHLKGLPRKIEHRERLTMPSPQAEAYAATVRHAIAGREVMSAHGGKLEALHRMRGISLHPIHPDDAPADLAGYAEQSARLRRTIDILDRVKAANEKALIFVESLAMHERLAALCAARYGIAPPMRINGTVPGTKRQELVNRFQARAGVFDVMILSPKAGGVGLNLTAANHVIHLSRWWNPAVEDQSTDRAYRIGQTKDVHVYLPLAVHPDPLIADTSFDLQLDALLERKRALSREMLAPPEAEGDAEALFGAVTGDALANATPATEAVAHPAAPLQVGAPLEPMVRTTKKPEPKTADAPPANAAPEFLRFRQHGDKARLQDDIVSRLRGRIVTQLRIHDPYALADDWNVRAQVSFVKALLPHVPAIKGILIRYRTESIDSGQTEVRQRQNIIAKLRDLAGGGVQRPVRLIGHERSHGHFHDRLVEIDQLGPTGDVMTHELMIGGGLRALFDPRAECTGYLALVPPKAGVE